MTKILIPSETSSGERRVSATPEAVKKLKALVVMFTLKVQQENYQDLVTYHMKNRAEQ